MDTDGREVLLYQKLTEGYASLYTLYKDDNLERKKKNGESYLMQQVDGSFK